MTLHADHLLRAVVPASPVAWRGIVYTVKRFEPQKAYVALWWKPDGGEPRALGAGEWRDRMPTPAPDDRFLLFVSDRSGSDQVWRLDAPDVPPVRLTALPRGDVRGIAVRPDGVAVIAFVVSPPTTDLPLAVELLTDPTGDRLPGVLPGFTVEDPVTAPAPTALARVHARARNREDGGGWFGGRIHLWRLDTDNGALWRLTSGDLDVEGPVFLGERLLACASAPGLIGDVDVTRGEIVAVDLVTGVTTTLPTPDGRPVALSPSADGRRLAFVLTAADDDEGAENAQAWVLDEVGCTPLEAGLDRPAMDLVLDDLCAAFRPARPVWRDNDHLVVAYTDRGSLRPRAVPLDGSPGHFLLDEPGVFAEACPTPDGRLVGVWSTSSSLPELAELGPDGVRLLTAHNRALAAEADFRTPEELELPSGATGWYLPPREASGPAPAILYIHGGPAVCYGHRLFLEMHWWADRGYAVLWPNPRGGQGYGRAFAGAILQDHQPGDVHALRSRPGPKVASWATADADDLLAFTDLLAARPEVDAARLCVAGGSYGGYMSLHLAATTDRFATAVMERGLYDWSSAVGSSDFGHAQHRLFGGRWPWEAPERYLAQSPIGKVSGVKCPTLVIHSEGDLRVGPEQGHRLFAALLQQGVPTALVLFPDESHGLTRTGRLDRRLERLRQIGAWLDRWLR